MIRYAGDEFVIVLNTMDEALAQRLIKTMQQQFEQYNAAHTNLYQLSGRTELQPYI